MTERQFDAADGFDGFDGFDASDLGGDGRCYDYGEMLDDLRCHSSESLHCMRLEAIAEQRWWHLRELAITAVLDERGQVDDSTAAKDGTTTRAARRKRRTAKKLARQPYVASAAAQGKLSPEQLDKLSDLAGDDPEADRPWAEQGPGWSPDDLADELRKQRKPSVEDAAARRAARELRYRWNRESGMLDGRFSLPDIDGALVEKVFDEMIERMRPAKGQPWDTREHRGADALVERLRADARIEPVLTGADGQPIVVGRTESVLSEKTKRVVKQRDGHCRYPGCDRRIGLQVHHLWPSSWGGSDDLWNLATVCTTHHAQLAPQGRLLLLGNPNHPAGLSLIDRDDLPTLAQLAADRARAGPSAA